MITYTEELWERKGSDVRVSRREKEEQIAKESREKEREGRVCTSAKEEEESIAANTPTRRTSATQYRN